MLTPARSLQVDSGVVVGLNELPIVCQSSSGTGRAEGAMGIWSVFG